MQSVGVSVARIFKNVVVQKCKNVSRTMFRKYLFLTNVGISASLSLAGDVLQQNYEMLANEKSRSWDKTRSWNMTASGVTVGVLCHHWYNFLDKRMPGRTVRLVLKKVAVDQLVASPVLISVFFITTCYLEKASWERTMDEIVQKGWRLYVAEWFIWPPAQMINFYILPTRYRVLYDNTISLGYDVYTSYVKHEIPMDDNVNDIPTPTPLMIEL